MDDLGRRNVVISYMNNEIISNGNQRLGFQRYLIYTARSARITVCPVGILENPALKNI